MSNPRNTGTLVGRLASDPKIFTNKDGSHKVLMTLFVDRNYTDKAGERASDAIPVEAFVSARTNGVGPYANVHQGDQVALQTTIQHQSWTGKDGSTRYETKVVAESVTYLESRQVTQARMASRVEELKAQAAQQTQAQAQPVAQPAAEQSAVMEAPAF